MCVQAACIDVLNQASSPIKAIMGDRPIMEHVSQKDECGLRVGSGTFFKQGYSFFSKPDSWGSVAIQELNKHILKKREDLTIELLQGKYQPTVCKDVEDVAVAAETSDNITLGDTGGIFVFFSIFALFSVALHLYRRYRRRQPALPPEAPSFYTREIKALRTRDAVVEGEVFAVVDL